MLLPLPFSVSQVEDVREKLQYGNCRIKKRRNKNVKTSNAVVVTNKLSGTMMEVSKYKEEWATQCFIVKLPHCSSPVSQRGCLKYQQVYGTHIGYG